MIVVIARYRAEEGADDKVAAALREYTPLTRAEPGCLAFAASQSREDPRDFVLYERYLDQAAFDAHASSPHYESIARDRIRPLLDHREVVFLDPIEP
ncbi:MAG: putative quinol monooxygenase [Egibacteraceae bacterium]